VRRAPVAGAHGGCGDRAVSDSQTLEVEAPAKINLFLRVLGRRPDGFHSLETVVLPVSLADRLRIHAYSDPTGFRTLSLELAVSGDPALTAGVPVDQTNLCLRAATALAERVGARGFAEIKLDKRVPNAAGMGGGSADAAAVLRALNDLWGCGLSTGELTAVAASVGSDVPALIAGGPGLARGRGDVVQPVALPSFRWAVLPLELVVATPDAFAWWDQDGAVTGPDPGEVLRTAAAGDPKALAPLVFNDLQGPVERRHPEVADARDAMLRGGALAALVTGSGPTVAGLFEEGAPIDVPGAIEVRSAGSAV
jgi:4-diphosphocytidyl-2-C-methyl-D-erythritol kinase